MPDHKKEYSETHWVLDKKIPLAVVIMLFIQIVTVVIWAARADSQIVDNEQGVVRNQKQIQELQKLERQQSNYYIRQSAQMEYLVEAIKKIERTVNSN